MTDSLPWGWEQVRETLTESTSEQSATRWVGVHRQTVLEMSRLTHKEPCLCRWTNGSVFWKVKVKGWAVFERRPDPCRGQELDNGELLKSCKQEIGLNKYSLLNDYKIEGISKIFCQAKEYKLYDFIYVKLYRIGKTNLRWMLSEQQLPMGTGIDQKRSWGTLRDDGNLLYLHWSGGYMDVIYLLKFIKLYT